MRKVAEFKRDVRRSVYDALESYGFARFSKEGVDRPINDNFHCWVGLNTGIYEDVVEINPFVGVHVESIEKMSASLKDQKYDRGIATYAIPMGDLESIKGERAFAFKINQSEQFIASEVDRISRLYAGVGVSFAESISSYEALLPLLQDRIDMLGGYPESVVCCLYLMGRKDDAKNLVLELAASEPEYFERFSAAFLGMFEA